MGSYFPLERTFQAGEELPPAVVPHSGSATVQYPSRETEPITGHGGCRWAKLSARSACPGEGARREGGSSPPGSNSHPPTQPDPASALGPGEVGMGGKRERSWHSLLGDGPTGVKKSSLSNFPRRHRVGYLSAKLDFFQDFCKRTEKREPVETFTVKCILGTLPHSDINYKC